MEGGGGDCGGAAIDVGVNSFTQWRGTESHFLSELDNLSFFSTFSYVFIFFFKKTHNQSFKSQ